MTKIVSITEHFQHFLADQKESFRGDLEGRTKLAWKHLFEAESERLRNRYAVLDSYERGPRQPRQYRNGFYEREFATRFGTLRLRIARARDRSFLPPAIEKFQRRAPELAMLIREAFLRGISTRQAGRLVAYGVRQDGTRQLLGFLRVRGTQAGHLKRRQSSLTAGSSRKVVN
jgi:transposase-like protein